MTITIYSKSGDRRAIISPGESSTQRKELEGDNVLSLTFTYFAHIDLDVNDYCDYEGERYWLMEQYHPAQKSDSEWEYDIKLYGTESLIKRFLVLETTDGNAEPVFTLTAPPREHVAMVVKCINSAFGSEDWKVGEVEGSDNIVIDYEGKYCDEALADIAEAVGGRAEWWIEGKTVNISRCEHGETLALAYGYGLLGLERDTSDTNKFYTRLFPIGSTRNIDAEKYGYQRLMLPGGKQYVEVGTDRYGIYDHYEESAFSDIYPRRVGKVSSVRSKAAKDDDGESYTIYYFKDADLDFDPNDYEISGLVKHVSFQEGSELAGLGSDDDHYFEVNYDSKTKEFEIITIWPYDDDTQLPGGSLVPKVGDEYILWNIRMPDSYYTLAETELSEAVDAYNEEHWQDISIYKGTTDHVWVEENGAELYVGRRVLLESPYYFPDGGERLSRITCLTRKVTLPGQVELEISDALQSGALDKVTDSVRELRNYTRERTSGSMPDIIKSGDNTLATDTNLYSARRSQKEFLSKTKADRARGRITFSDGLTLGDEAAKIDADGAAELLSAVVRTALSSPTFVSGFTGEGWRLWLDGTGLSELELDKLTVRQTMRVFELIIDKIRSVGGQIIASAANGKVKEVSDISGTLWKLTMEDSCQFKAGDLIRCQTFTGEKLKSYWVEVTYANTEFVFVRQSDFDDGVVPKAGDEVVLMGSTTGEKRQNLISISATDDGQPRIDVLNGVKGKSLDGCLRARLGNLDGIKDSWFGALDDEEAQPHGDGLYADNAYLKGTFVLSSGEDVKTKLEATDGKIESTVEGLRDDVTSKDSYLNNPTFAQGLEYWGFNSSTVFYMVGDLWVWADEGVLAAKGSDSEVTTEDRKCVARIIGGYIRQKNADMRMLPTIEADSDGRKNAVPFYVSFLYKCTTAGTLKVYFSGVDKTGFEAFDSLSVETEIDATTGWKHVTYSGMWNGTGDFVMEFSGEINISMVILTPNEAETFYVKYKTFFEQSDKLVNIGAQYFDEKGNVLAQGGIMTTATWNEFYNKYFDPDTGQMTAAAGMVSSTDLEKFEKETDGKFKTVTASIEESARTFTDWKSDEYASDQSKKLSIADFSSLFASAVTDQGIAKKAQLSTYVAKVTNEKTGKTQLESGVLVLGDNIDLRGCTTINDYFQVDQDGKMRAKDGEFSGKLTATEGEIGGFDIGTDAIGTSATDAGDNPTSVEATSYLGHGSLNLQNHYGYVNVSSANSPFATFTLRSWTSGGDSTCVKIANRNRADYTTGTDADEKPRHVALDVDGNLIVEGPYLCLFDRESYQAHNAKTQNGRVWGFGRRVTVVSEDTSLGWYHDIVVLAAKGLTITLPHPGNAVGKEIMVMTRGYTYKVTNSSSEKLLYAKSGDYYQLVSSLDCAARPRTFVSDGTYWYECMGN